MLHLANYVTIALENSRLYEKLKASDKAKQKVISHLSHELKTPLAILETIFALIERKLTAAHDRSLDRIIARGKRNVSRLAHQPLLSGEDYRDRRAVVDFNGQQCARKRGCQPA